MDELRGTISERELKTYNGAEIILLQNSNNGTTSDISGDLSGSGSYEWRISWNEDGFIGIDWNAFSGEDQLQVYGSVAAVIEAIREDPVEFAISVATTNGPARRAGCASADRTL